MRGVDARSGRALAGREHLSQSARDILTTPVGSRAMLRAYGSRVFQLTDRPMNGVLIALIIAESADALRRWEPRYRLTSVALRAVSPGHLRLDLRGEQVDDGSELTIAVNV